MSFILEESAIKNNLLQTLDGPAPIYTPDSSFVEYYFNLYVDHEIDEAEICQGVNRLKSQGIYVDEEFNCPEIAITPIKKDLYGQSGQFDAQICDTDPVDQKPRAKFIKNN